MFKVKFKDDHDKQIYTVYCRSDDLDLRAHPYFVSINRLIQPNHSPIIAVDNKERKRFQNTEALLIPVQNIILIEKVEDEKPRISELKPAHLTQGIDAKKENNSGIDLKTQI